MNNEKNLIELQKTIGYQFTNTALLKQAMIHKSYTNEHNLTRSACNERLEFMGDAVLELVTSDYLFKKFPDKQEGELSQLRRNMVCEPALAYCSRDINIGACLLLGKGEEMGGGREKESLTSDAMEALIGAIYFDSGFEAAAGFIHNFILNDLESREVFHDSKTPLQELAAQLSKEQIKYVEEREEGQQHDKTFYISVYLGERLLAKGVGKSKKHAEQDAASKAIQLLKKEQKGKL